MEPIFLIGIAALIIFAGLGFYFGLRRGQHEGLKAVEQARALEEALEDSQEQLLGYQSEVTDHFTQTAELINTMTAQYATLYQHLGKGAENLCPDGMKPLSQGVNPQLLLERLHEVQEVDEAVIEEAFEPAIDDTIEPEADDTFEPVSDDTFEQLDDLSFGPDESLDAGEERPLAY